MADMQKKFKKEFGKKTNDLYGDIKAEFLALTAEELKRKEREIRLSVDEYESYNPYTAVSAVMSFAALIVSVFSVLYSDNELGLKIMMTVIALFALVIEVYLCCVVSKTGISREKYIYNKYKLRIIEEINQERAVVKVRRGGKNHRTQNNNATRAQTDI